MGELERVEVSDTVQMDTGYTSRSYHSTWQEGCIITLVKPLIGTGIKITARLQCNSLYWGEWYASLNGIAITDIYHLDGGGGETEVTLTADTGSINAQAGDTISLWGRSSVAYKATSYNFRLCFTYVYFYVADLVLEPNRPEDEIYSWQVKLFGSKGYFKNTKYKF